MLEVFTYISFALAGFVLLYSFIFLNKISRFIKADKLGIIEKDLVGLVQVVVVAHAVEEPTNTLLKAVKANCLREVPVKYLFLISQSQADSALSGYYKMFTTIVEIAFAERGDNLDLADYVQIKRLPYDWPDVPYIFYQCTKKDSNERHTVAFRGNQRGEGIADYYERLPVSRTKATFMPLLTEAPSEIKENLTFTDEIETIKFPSKTA